MSAAPSCLVAEAIGQLAAWIAMAAVEFQRRPVAALAGEVKISREVTPGAVVDLAVAVDNCSRDAIAYHGSACVGGAPVVELHQCVGPMLAMEEFDDPEAVRAHFETLRGHGWSRPVGDGIPAGSVAITVHEMTESKRARIQIPTAAPFFADHFPRKPVLPATLLLDAQIRLAIALAADVVDSSVRELLRPTRVRNVKVRSFVSPGEVVELGCEILSVTDNTAEAALMASAAGRRVATARLSVGQWEA
ncbi:MAG TPA: hypothetical protein VL403_14065 [Candidatus Kryptonia bacterium]|nr:hypothetical protein [Candidatus Kryptonia bacterium]